MPAKKKKRSKRKRPQRKDGSVAAGGASAEEAAAEAAAAAAAVEEEGPPREATPEPSSLRPPANLGEWRWNWTAAALPPGVVFPSSGVYGGSSSSSSGLPQQQGYVMAHAVMPMQVMAVPFPHASVAFLPQTAFFPF